jgi:hypothetical protein
MSRHSQKGAIPLHRLAEALAHFRGDRKLPDFDEITLKQTVILQVLNILGWNIFSADEVAPEYSVETRRVDYSLRLQKRDAVFVEVKKPKEDLDRHQEQLLDYAFRQGVELAILTNGITWWLYLPLKTGDWSERKFYSVDLMEQEPDQAAERLQEFLSKDNVADGSAVEKAEKLHSGQRRRTIIKETMPEAWNKLVTEPDSILVDLLVEATERICGHRPDQNTVVRFIRARQDQILVDTMDDEIARSILKTRRPDSRATNGAPVTTATPRAARSSGRSVGTIRVRFDRKELDAPSIPQLYGAVLKALVEDDRISNIEIPWGVGTRRHFIAKGPNPVHPSGRPFFAPVEYRGFVMEAHVNRASGVRYLAEFCRRLGVDFELIDL